MAVLRARLYEKMLAEQQAAEGAERLAQIGSVHVQLHPGEPAGLADEPLRRKKGIFIPFSRKVFGCPIQRGFDGPLAH